MSGSPTSPSAWCGGVHSTWAQVCGDTIPTSSIVALVVGIWKAESTTCAGLVWGVSDIGSHHGASDHGAAAEFWRIMWERRTVWHGILMKVGEYLGAVTQTQEPPGDVVGYEVARATHYSGRAVMMPIPEVPFVPCNNGERLVLRVKLKEG